MFYIYLLYIIYFIIYINILYTIWTRNLERDEDSFSLTLWLILDNKDEEFIFVLVERKEWDFHIHWIIKSE